MLAEGDAVYSLWRLWLNVVSAMEVAIAKSTNAAEP